MRTEFDVLLIAPHSVEPYRIRNMIKHLRESGPPTLYVAPLEPGKYTVLRGSTRTATAAQLGMRPNLIVLGPACYDLPAEEVLRGEETAADTMGITPEIWEQIRGGPPETAEDFIRSAHEHVRQMQADELKEAEHHFAVVSVTDWAPPA